MPTDPKVSSIAYVLIRTLDRTSVIKKAEGERAHPRGNAPHDKVGQRKCHKLADDRGNSTDPEGRQQDTRKRLVCKLVIVLDRCRGIFNGTDAPRRKLLQAFDCQID